MSETERTQVEGNLLISRNQNYLIEQASKSVQKDKKAKLIETDSYNPYYEHYFWNKRT